VDDSYLTDDERWQQIKAWWKKNGVMLLVGVSIGLAIVLSWRNIQDGNKQKVEAGSFAFERLKIQMLKRSPQYLQVNKKADKTKLDGEAVASAKKIIQDFAGTPYAIDAALLLAKIYIEKNDLGSAESYLEWALTSLDVSDIKYFLAKMRIGRVLRDKGEHEKALAHLVNVKPPVELRKYFEFIKGTIYEGQRSCLFATNAYQKAIKIIETESKASKEKAVEQKGFQQIVEQRLEVVRNC